ncbi:class F sortase [Homoserinimonas sp. OAct 916]|uniref:class F sortase n=1 Tax=Homoserinimonas sp. OAct 916 TaxID=2211450 RepID=UPI000DBE6849|nr:class F sortase [Homoserinimonas sp. OAct 916]
MNAATRNLRSLVAAFAVAALLAGCSMTATTVDSAAAPSTPSVAVSPAPPSPRPTARKDVRTVSAGLDTQSPQAVPPIRLRINDLDIDMTVEPIGLATDGAMALPENPADAAWYRYGAWPGSDQGSIVIAAHVDSLNYPLGPMARLPEAVPGTQIIVTTADGTEVVYVVADEGFVVKRDVPWADVFDRTGEPRLTIVTCGGEFDYERRTYLSNVIVTALPSE